MRPRPVHPAAVLVLPCATICIDRLSSGKTPCGHSAHGSVPLVTLSSRNIRVRAAVVHWFVIIVGGYAGIGLIAFVRRVPFANGWDRLGYGVLVFHLGGSVVFHAYMLMVDDYGALTVFPYGYSFFAVAYFIGLGLYVRRTYRRGFERPILCLSLSSGKIWPRGCGLDRDLAPSVRR